MIHIITCLNSIQQIIIDNKQVLGATYMQGTILGPEDTRINFKKQICFLFNYTDKIL